MTVYDFGEKPCTHDIIEGWNDRVFYWGFWWTFPLYENGKLLLI